MRGLRRTTFRGRPLGHGLAVALALVSYLTTAIGCPLPTILHKDRSQPFPCQDHACGCQSAEACWRHCCCFTPEERLAWAQEHHIEPPAYAEKPRPQGWRTVPLRGQAEGQTACCTTPGHASSTCCSAEPSRPAKDPAPKAGSRWILGLAALHCQGTPTQWLLSGAASPPPIPLDWNPGWPLVGRVQTRDPFASSYPLRPPDPPPRPLPA
jgi:hypothetical protein